jgi:uncharacterized protein involved in exopolysaccharide biosynthesis
MDNSSNISYSDQDINVQELLSVIWAQKLLIILATLFAGFGSIIYSLSLENEYTSQAILTLAGQEAQSGSMGGSSGQLGGLASLAGISVGGTSNKAALAIKTIESRDFLKHLLQFEGVLSTLVGIQQYNQKTQEVTYEDGFSSETTLVPDDLLFLEIYKAFRGTINLSDDSKTGLISLSVTSKSPKAAYDLAIIILRELNNVYRAEALEESSKALSYLNNKLSSTMQNEVKKSMSQVIESQLKIQMFANIRENYLLKPFDNAFIPDVKSGPSRSVICIVITLSGFFIAIISSLAAYFFTKTKTKTKTKI